MAATVSGDNNDESTELEIQSIHENIQLPQEELELPRRELEDRIEELETRLAVVSRLLQRHHIASTPQRCISPPPPPSSNDHSPIDHFSNSRTPYLESPAPGMSSSKTKYENATSEGMLMHDLLDEQSFASSSHNKEDETKAYPVLLPTHSSEGIHVDSNTDHKNDKSQKSTPTMTLLPRRLHQISDEFFSPEETQPSLEESNISIRSQWLDFLNHSFPVESTFDVDMQMQEFVRVPGCVENLFFFGWIICLDCYLTMLTALPVRFLWSCVLLTCTVYQTATKGTSPKGKWAFHRRHCYQLIQVLMIVLIYRYVLCNISIGTLYHWIRGQEMMKLYVIAAMIEIFDRLLSSLGQDCLDSLYWNTVNNPKSQRFLVAILVVSVYASIHTMLLLVHITTLNVALNNKSDHTVLTLLISGNFAEVKSTVFKKYNKTALFKIAASDICERFKLMLFLTLVWLVHVSQDGDRAPLFLYGKIGASVMLSEIVADWMKHAFICKFNFLKSRVYREYGLILAGDYTGIGHEEYNLDPTHAVVKRIGFAQIPLVGVLLKMAAEMIKYGGRPSIGSMVCLWLFLVAVKAALGTLLKRWALVRLQSAPEYLQSSQSSKKNQ